MKCICVFDMILRIEMIIFPHVVKQLVFVMEMQFVCCEVGPEFSLRYYLGRIRCSTVDIASW